MPDFEKTGQKCDKCGGDMVIKTGKFGKFTGCSNYPDCKNILKSEKSEPVRTDEICDKCGKGMVKRNGQFGDFLACSGYPECRNTKKVLSN
ncbi:MAG: topoisomerase DNA-binding C4 zinc finger domain-containing protein [Patescibacteria group bacterium]